MPLNYRLTIRIMCTCLTRPSSAPSSAIHMYSVKSGLLVSSGFFILMILLNFDKRVDDCKACMIGPNKLLGLSQMTTVTVKCGHVVY